MAEQLAIFGEPPKRRKPSSRGAHPNTIPILESYAQYMNTEAIWKHGPTRGAARNLAELGLDPDDLFDFLDWIKRQPWVQGVDLVLAQTMYLRWLDVQRPDLNVEVERIRTSTDFKYLGSMGEKQRQQDIARLEARR